MKKILCVLFMVMNFSIAYAMVDPCPPYSPGVNTGATPVGPSDAGAYIDRIGNTTSYSSTLR